MNSQDEHGCTSLVTAISAGYPLVVVKLLQARCDCNLATFRHVSPLHQAATHGSAGIIQLLLMRGAKPTTWNDCGESPLSIAIKAQQTPVVQALLLGCSHVDPNGTAADLRCPNPLFYSLKRNKFVIAWSLLISGYRAMLELTTYLHSVPNSHGNNSDEQNSLPLEERLGKQYFLIASMLPLSLQDLCRITIRELLSFSIWDKLKELQLPQPILDYLCYKDIYSPPVLESESDVYYFFSDHAREIYELI